MAQQSTTRPREAEKATGPKTRQQQKAILERREVARGANVSPRGKSIAEGGREPPPKLYDLESGDRSIQRGAHQETEHHKNRES